MKLSDLPPAACRAAFVAWRAGAGPLLPYVKSTPFVSLDRYPAPLELDDTIALPTHLTDVPDTAPTELVVLDLPGSSCLQTGLDLLATRGCWPVLTFGHWYHPHGLVGDPVSATLLLRRAPAAPWLPEVEPAAAVEGTTPPPALALLVDYDRYQGDAPPPLERFNNWYELTELDLPSAEELRLIGYTGVCLVSMAPPKDDLNRYAAYLAASGLTVRWQEV